MLQENQLEAIELLIKGDHTIKSIAEKVGVSRGTMYNWFKNPKFKSKLHEMQQLKDEVLKENVKGNTEASIRELERLRDNSKNDMVRYHTASLLLAYAGWSDRQVTEVNVNHSSDHVKNKMIELLKQEQKKDKQNE